MFGLTACSEKKGFNYNYEGNFIAEKGGTLIDAMSGEPSNLISMIAGDSASSAISANIFNKLIMCMYVCMYACVHLTPGSDQSKRRGSNADLIGIRA